MFRWCSYCQNDLLTEALALQIEPAELLFNIRTSQKTKINQPLVLIGGLAIKKDTPQIAGVELFTGSIHELIERVSNAIESKHHKVS